MSEQYKEEYQYIKELSGRKHGSERKSFGYTFNGEGRFEAAASFGTGNRSMDGFIGKIFLRSSNILGAVKDRRM